MPPIFTYPLLLSVPIKANPLSKTTAANYSFPPQAQGRLGKRKARLDSTFKKIALKTSDMSHHHRHNFVNQKPYLLQPFKWDKLSCSLLLSLHLIQRTSNFFTMGRLSSFCARCTNNLFTRIGILAGCMQ